MQETKSELRPDHTICTEKFDIFLRTENLFQINIHPHVDISSTEVKLMVKHAFELSRGRVLPAIIIVGEFGTFGEDARAYSADAERETAASAIAYVINNLGHRIVANFYLKIHKPPKPVRFFSEESEAIQWLEQLEF